jgi:hypothetical protein
MKCHATSSGGFKRILTGVTVAATVGAVVQAGDDLRIANPPAANPETPPVSGVQANAIANNFSLRRIAQGSDPLENPSGVIKWFGLLDDADSSATPPKPQTKTEPDENTYLVLDHNPGGPTAGYHYGRHFLIQGHENSGNLAYVTRINLDVSDPAHRITLLTPVDPTSGLTRFNSIDGSSWDPFTETMLFTQEAGSNGGVIELPLDWSTATPPPSRTLDCVLGKAGFEGIHPDDQGNLILVEDVGGASVSIDPSDIDGPLKVAKQPNSFVYRFVPYNRHDLGQGGKLYALQAVVDGAPIVFGGTTAAAAFADTYSDAQKDLRQPGSSWPALWVLVHDTGQGFDIANCSAFDANALAKSASATPFKRPENGQFLPGSRFDTFFFDETGDTDARAGQVQELAERGSWGSIFRVDFPFGNHAGRIRIVVTGDAAHASFDNMAFADGETLLVAEDRGDLLHDQLNAPGNPSNVGLLDSVWAFDVVDFDKKPRRLIALGRDEVSAPIGEEDNEPTGLHVSDGSSSRFEVLGTRKPSGPEGSGGGFEQPHRRRVDDGDFRWFVTQQHGLNQVFEILGAK